MKKDTSNCRNNLNLKKLILLISIMFLAGCEMKGSDPNPPDPPGAVKISQKNGMIVLEWYKVDNADSYNIYWKNEKGVTKENGNKITNVTSPYTHREYSLTTDYCYIVTSKNGKRESDKSQEQCIPASAQPLSIDLRIEEGDTKVRLAWDEKEGERYNIYFSTQEDLKNKKEYQNETSPFIHEGLINGRTYYYQVSALNLSDIKIRESAILGIKPKAGKEMKSDIPDPPKNVMAYSGNKMVLIKWNEAEGAKKYNIYWSNEKGVTKENGKKISNIETTEYLHENLINGRPYYYILTAENEKGESSPSIEINSLQTIKTINGKIMNNASENPRISKDGRYIVFESKADNLVEGDTNGKKDIFIYDRETRTIKRVSINNGTEANGESEKPVISGDGKYIVFESKADNMVEGDNNNKRDLFYYERETGKINRIIRINENNEKKEGNGDSYNPSLSGDGRYIVFESKAGNLVEGDTNGEKDIFIYDRKTERIKRIVNTDKKEGNNDSSNPAISEDGRYIAFESRADNLVEGDTNNTKDIFYYDRETGKIKRVSVNTKKEEADKESKNPTISTDGRHIAFTSCAGNLVEGDNNDRCDIFVYSNIYDRETGIITRVSISKNEANDDSQNPVISGDGRYIVFESKADNLVEGDTNEANDVFIYDRIEKKIKRLSLNDKKEEGNKDSQSPVISGDGRYIVFESEADNLMEEDDNDAKDIFIAPNEVSAVPGDRLEILIVKNFGEGRIVGETEGIDCGKECIKVLIKGTEVSLRAIPEGGSKFLGWSKEECQTERCNFTINEYTFLQANFVKRLYTIKASTGKGGRIEPSMEIQVEYGEDKTFQLIPEEGYKVKDVIIDKDKSQYSQKEYIFKNITSNHTIEVTFEEINLIKLEITPKNIVVPDGEEIHYISKGVYDNEREKELTQKVKWKSSDPTIAKIKSKGIIETLKDGTVEIEAEIYGIRTTASLRILKQEEDADQDGLNNKKEYALGTNPEKSDTDEDGMPDKWEVDNKLNPLEDNKNMDADKDLLYDIEELAEQTDPNNPDTDGDEMPDGWEVTYELKPLEKDANEDPDCDEVVNIEEYKRGTKPNDTAYIVEDLKIEDKGDDWIRLSWKSPGKKNKSGQEVEYDLRYSKEQITKENWSIETIVFKAENEPWPAEEGVTQEITITGLEINTGYNFAMRVK